MNKKYLPLLLFIILLIICVYPIQPASSETEMESNIPNVAQLKIRVKQLYEAEIKEDLRTWYDLSTHSLNKILPKEEVSSYEEFKKEFSRQKKNDKFKITSWGINKITLEKKQKNNKPVAIVKMDIFIKEMFKKPEKVKDQTDYWIYINNTWYWTWRGWPYD
jgi:hypothetical protein